MMRSLISLFVAALVASCTTVDNLRQQSIAWAAVYPVKFDAMANCLTMRMVEDAGTGLYTVTPQFYQDDRRAVVTGMAGSRADVEFTVRQISQTDSEVTFRRSQSVVNNDSAIAKSRAIADRCGKSA